MTISAALQFRGKSSTTWSTLSSHNFVGLKGKAQSRAVGASCLVPYRGRFVVATVPHSHLYTSKNHTSTPIFQEIIQIGGLNTLKSNTHTALQVQEVSEQSEGIPVTDSSEAILKSSTHTVSQVQEVSEQSEGIPVTDSSDALLDHSKHCVKGGAKIVQSAWLPSTVSNTKKKRVAWNKGQHRSEETKEKIRARTRQAMEDPKIRERLRKAREGATQSSETKLKIKSGLLNFWELKREAKKMRESCLREWEELIADTARRGSDGNTVYQWNSYNILMKELINSHKKIRVKKARTDRKSADHKRNIAAAIRAKWADPDYSKRVRRGRDVYFSNRVCLSSDPSAEVNWSSCDAQRTGVVDRMKEVDTMKEVDMMKELDRMKEPTYASSTNRMKQLMHASSTNKPSESYKDPMTQDKLEKLKQMRFSRHFEEDRKRRDMMERAWVLMAEAKRAADALEAIKGKDKNAVASLMEARRLLAEAERLIKNAGLRMDWPKTAHLEVESIEGATGIDLSKAYSVLNQSSFASLK